MNTEFIVNKLNELVKERETVKNYPSIDIHFGINANNQLTVNGIALCDVSVIDADNACYDVEYFFVRTINGSEYEIHLDFPNEGPAKINFIHLVVTSVIPVYCADSQ